MTYFVVEHTDKFGWVTVLRGVSLVEAQEYERRHTDRAVAIHRELDGVWVG